MIDFKLFVDALLTGTPLAILVAFVGVVWQAAYTRSRDKFHDAQVQREIGLEREKFENQKKIEGIRFEYEQQRWREELSRDITLKLLEIRIDEYSKVWSYAEGVARNQLDAGAITTEVTKNIATKIKSWRYSKGGLIAAENTRDAAFAFQTALWNYDGSEESRTSLRRARWIFRGALRADTGIGDNLLGENLLDAAEEMQKINREQINELQSKLDIKPETG